MSRMVSDLLYPRQTGKLIKARYHGKCLKIARGKVKEDDKYTCPICDWRVKIPRDAARPKLEDLQAWQDELENLPFQPEEEDCLNNIVDQAANFRDAVAPYMNDLTCTAADLPVQRFYLRKIEGADILLTKETNFFRQQLHKWAPVTEQPPPTIEMSSSTRKPRPTKQQKLMAQMGISNPDDLPDHLKSKTQRARKDSTKDSKAPKNLQPAPPESHTPPGLPRTMSVGNATQAGSSSSHPYFGGNADIPSSNTPLFSTNDTDSIPRGLSPAFGAPASADAHGLSHIDPAMFSGRANDSSGRPSPTEDHFSGLANSALDALLATEGKETQEELFAVARDVQTPEPKEDDEGVVDQYLNS